MDLTQGFEDQFEYGDLVLHVDMAFDNILRFHNLLEDDDFSDEEKIIVGLEVLLFDYWKVENWAIQDQFNLFLYIMEKFLDQKIGENTTEKETDGEPTPKQKDYDFNVDAERIYASFLMDYNMDLFEQQGKLHWKKFLALLEGLTEKTPFMQVVNIRTMDIPKKDDHKNQFEKSRRKIAKLKRQYAIGQEDKNPDDVFEDMITAFGGRGEDNS